MASDAAKLEGKAERGVRELGRSRRKSRRRRERRDEYPQPKENCT